MGGRRIAWLAFPARNKSRRWLLYDLAPGQKSGPNQPPNAGSTRTRSSGHKVFFPLFTLRLRDGSVERKELHGRLGFFKCQRDCQIVKGIAFKDGCEVLVDQRECPCICVVHIPALRHRPGDTALLANHFLERYRARYGSSRRTFPKDLMERFTECQWPGNRRDGDGRRHCYNAYVRFEKSG